MSDITQELRNHCRCGGICLRCRAADEIERLRKTLVMVVNVGSGEAQRLALKALRATEQEASDE